MARLLLLLLAIITATIVFELAQCIPLPESLPAAAPEPAPPNATKDYLDAHNKARSEVGVDPLNWNSDLAKSASLQARYSRDHKNCSFADLTNSKYGGNQLRASGFSVTPTVAVETWVAEKKFYDYGNNSCTPNHQCGVYTQVVWRNSVELGCALAQCSGKVPAGLIVICLYNPPGNVVGEKPY